MYTARPKFSIARSSSVRHLHVRTQTNHGLGSGKFPAKSTPGVVSVLRSPFGGRRPLSGAERFSAGVVFESAVCFMGLRTPGIFARRRAVVAPRSTISVHGVPNFFSIDSSFPKLFRQYTA